MKFLAGERKTAVTEHILFCMLLAFIGGFMDVYSYVVRGGVFATGQTGNFVLLALAFLRREPLRAGRAAVPIGCFWLGVFLSQHFLYLMPSHEEKRWKQTVLGVEIAAMLLAGFIPAEAADLLPNAIISFSAAMQFSCFRFIGGNSSFASVFCTGNMRSCAENYYRGLVLKDGGSIKNALYYTGVLAAFFFGVLAGGFISELAGVRAIWADALLLAAALALTFVRPRGSAGSER